MILEACILGAAWIVVKAFDLADKVHKRQTEADEDPRRAAIREKRRVLERRLSYIRGMSMDTEAGKRKRGEALNEVEKMLLTLADEEAKR